MHDSDTGAPPPPGADTPVPADAAARAAAAGRAPRARRSDAPASDDRLVPDTALEQRAAARAEQRRRATPWWQQPPPGVVANPAAGMPGASTAPTAMLPPGLAPAVADAMPQRFVPVAWQQAAPPPPSPQSAWPPPTGAQAWPQQPWSAPPGPQGWAPQPAQPWTQAAWVPPGAWPQQPQQLVLQLPPPPRIRWSGRQRAAAILGSWAGQTIMALAVHLLIAASLVVGLFALILEADGTSAADIEGDAFSSVVALWSTPERLWATALVVLASTGAVLALGWLVQALWQRQAGLVAPHRSTWLAWLCTTAATGLLGTVLWPGALVGGAFVLLASSDASFSTGSLWAVLFVELAGAVVLTGLVGLLFGWLFLSTSRPRIDPAAEAAAAEAAARARDEAELGRGRDRWADA